jgi:very-short-patch-repair endonuclease
MGIIKKRVRDLRKIQTEAEKYFWNKVRNNQLNLNFRRQYPLVYYKDNNRKLFIADFICKSKKLVIEIDGKIHDSQKEYDEARTFIINHLGYKVLRFTNNQVLNNFSKIEEILSPFNGER